MEVKDGVTDQQNEVICADVMDGVRLGFEGLHRLMGYMNRVWSVCTEGA